MILKLLLVIGVIAIIYFMFIKQKPLASKPSKKQKKKDDAIDEMVECAHCGVYVTLNEAILSNGKYYCSRECIIKAK